MGLKSSRSYESGLAALMKISGDMLVEANLDVTKRERGKAAAGRVDAAMARRLLDTTSYIWLSLFLASDKCAKDARSLDSVASTSLRLGQPSRFQFAESQHYHSFATDTERHTLFSLRC